MDLDLLLARLAVAFYLSGALLSFAAVLAGRQRAMRWVTGVALAGWALHMASFFRIWAESGRFPLENTPERVHFLAGAAVLVYLLAAVVYGLEILGVIMLPLAVVLIFISNFLPQNVISVPETIQPGLRVFHVTVATLGVAALFLAFGASVIYLIQERGLKAKRPPRLLLRLPSIQRCDEVGHLALLWGFPLLTLAIITGAIWSANARAVYWLYHGRETFALLAWLILAVILYARLVSGWRGRKAAYLTILAFTAVLARMMGFFIPLSS